MIIIFTWLGSSGKKTWYNFLYYDSKPGGSMYGIFPYIWLIFVVNVDKNIPYTSIYMDPRGFTKRLNLRCFFHNFFEVPRYHGKPIPGLHKAVQRNRQKNTRNVLDKDVERHCCRGDHLSVTQIGKIGTFHLESAKILVYFGSNGAYLWDWVKRKPMQKNSMGIDGTHTQKLG